MPVNLVSLVVLTGILGWFASAAVRVVREFERLVVFRLGHLLGTRGPGVVFLIPFIDSGVKLSLRLVTFDVPAQEVITRDNVTTRVNAVVYYRVVDPARTVVNVENFHRATAELAATTLRSVVGQVELDQLLTERERLNSKLQQILDEATDRWGIKVTTVEIKDVVIPPDLLSAIARQAEAERERRALIIHAEGERQAAQRLSEAAKILSAEPGGLALRVLRTLPDLADRKGSTIIFPLPVEIAPMLGGFRPPNTVGAGDRNERTAPPDPPTDLVPREH